MARIVDTSVLAEAERRQVPPEDVIEALGWNEPIRLASITASELLVGVEHATGLRRERRSRWVEHILANAPILGFDLEAARTHAQLSALLTRRGQIIGAHDLLIAATALTHGCSVVTGNVREFARVDGLEVIQHRWPEST